MKVIFKPENDFPASNHLLMYQRPVVRAGLKKKAGEAEELQGTWLRPGVNDLSEDEWKYILEHADTEERLRRGVFKEVLPKKLEADAVPTGTLADFALPEARDIIFNTHDPEWLQRTQTVDNRPEIQRYCAERLKVMEQKSNLNAAPSYGQR